MIAPAEDGPRETAIPHPRALPVLRRAPRLGIPSGPDLCRGEGSMRLVTRGDLDGLTCAVLISTCEPIDEILLIHPQDITDRTVPITPQDILANLPYHPSCGKWFDHHLLTESNTQP